MTQSTIERHVREGTHDCSQTKGGWWRVTNGAGHLIFRACADCEIVKRAIFRQPRGDAETCISGVLDELSDALGGVLKGGKPR